MIRAPLVNLLLVCLPICLAFSIFRYRLWDIDVIIRRTLIYGTLTVFLALIYYGTITVLQGVVTSISGQESAAAVVVSTLVIAALFTPLRRRIQDLIDRHFYRRKYDTAEILARFAATAQEEVELEPLAENLLDVVDRTMQPEGVSLWLREGQGATFEPMKKFRQDAERLRLATGKSPTAGSTRNFKIRKLAIRIGRNL
jgi:hypothetical protein